MTDSCATCFFYRKQYAVNVCRRNSPYVAAIVAGIAESQWPQVSPNDWCGQWATGYPVTGPTKDVLPSNRTYYVRSDGSDGNNGLANTAGGAFLTFQHAVDNIVRTLDTAGYTVTIQLGTSATVNVTGDGITLSGWTGGGQLHLDFNGQIFNCTGNCIRTVGGTSLGNVVTLYNVSLKGDTGIYHQATGFIALGTGVDFNTCSTFHMASTLVGSIIPTANYTISGGALAHVIATKHGEIELNSVTTQFAQSVTFGLAYAVASDGGIIVSSGVTFDTATHSATVTGKRYAVTNQALIDTAGAGANYFPGTVAGTPVPTTLGADGSYYA